MARNHVEEEITQLATRIPKDLHRQLKLHCVVNDIQVMQFVVGAVEESLRRKRGEGKGRKWLTREASD